MRKTVNREKISGRIYEHNLAEKVTGATSKNPGTPYIGGSINVATDDEMCNVITVYFPYVTEMTKNNTKNNTYIALKKIINEGKTILNDGADAATMVKIDTAINVNDFYTSRNGEETLVSAKRNEGGFVTIVSKLEDEKERNKFEFDMFIRSTQYVEADEEKNIAEDYLILNGFTFDFMGSAIPVDCVVKGKGGIKYFESLDINAQNPIFTKVWGNICSQTIVTKSTEEAAFGEAAVKEYSRSVREWVVVGAAKEVYEIGDDKNGITAEEWNEKKAARERHLAEVKARQEEYQATKANANNAFNTASSLIKPAAPGGFDFL